MNYDKYLPIKKFYLTFVIFGVLISNQVLSEEIIEDKTNVVEQSVTVAVTPTETATQAAPQETVSPTTNNNDSVTANHETPSALPVTEPQTPSTPPLKESTIQQPSTIIEQSSNEELLSLRDKLAKVATERDEAFTQLKALRNDVDGIIANQNNTVQHANELEIDLRSARSRIFILEKTNLEQVNDLESKLNDATVAARNCGENLINLENHSRTTLTELQQKNHELTNNLNGLNEQHAQDSLVLTEVKNQLTKCDAAFANVTTQLQERETTLATTQNQLLARNNEFNVLQDQFQQKEAILSETKAQLTQTNANLANVTTQLQDREKIINATQEQLNERNATLNNLQAQLNEREALIATTNERLNSEQTLNKNLTADINNAKQAKNQLQERLSQLEIDNNNCSSELNKIKLELTELNTQYDTLKNLYQNLTNSLAPADGGKLDAQTARDLAKDVYVRYRTIWENHLRQPRDLTLIEQANQARYELFLAQYRVMRAISGKELYIVRSADSLSSLARLAWGEANRGSEIRAANSHLITNNNQLLVGTPLIIP